MLLLLARHGNTFEKGDKVVWVGARTDIPLTAKGRDQAAALAAGLQPVSLSISERSRGRCSEPASMPASWRISLDCLHPPPTSACARSITEFGRGNPPRKFRLSAAKPS